LYGPLHTAQVEPVRPMKVSSTDDKYGLDPAYKKPILKHRTLSEMLTIHQPSSPILEATKQEEDDEGSQSGRPPLVQTKSDTNIVRVRTGGLRHFSPDTDTRLFTKSQVAARNTSVSTHSSNRSLRWMNLRINKCPTRPTTTCSKCDPARLVRPDHLAHRSVGTRHLDQAVTENT
jgi:hypothetical protein